LSCRRSTTPASISGFHVGITATRAGGCWTRCWAGRAPGRSFKAFQTAKLPLSKPWRQMRQLLLAADCIATEHPMGEPLPGSAFPTWVTDCPSHGYQHVGNRRRSVRADLFCRSTPSLSGALTDWRRATSPRLPALNRRRTNWRSSKRSTTKTCRWCSWDNHRPPGRDTSRAAMRPAARTRRVRFLDLAAEEELPLFYAGAAAHILPSWVEPARLSSLEAGASDVG